MFVNTFLKNILNDLYWTYYQELFIVNIIINNAMIIAKNGNVN